MTLADDIKRQINKNTVDYVGKHGAATINALVELVGDVYENLSHLPTNILDDVAEIAALAKGE